MLKIANIVAALVALLVSSSIVAADVADQRPPLKQVLELWRTRQAQVKTLRVEFTLDYTRTTNADPFKAETVQQTGKLWIDGDRWRADCCGPHWRLGERKFVNTNYVRLWDGERDLINHDLKERTDTVYPTATINPANAKGLGVLQPATLAWLVNFRNDHPVYGAIRDGGYCWTTESAVIDGRSCVAVEDTSHSPGWRFWLCPELDYRVLRRELDSVDTGGPGFRDELYYRPHPDLGWVPDKWTFQAYGMDNNRKSILSESFRFTATDLSINEPFPEQPFDYTIPEGTRVTDFRSPAEANKYLVRQDGEKRPILKQEIARGARYNEYVNTAPGDAGRPARAPEVNWWFWGSVLVFLIALGRFVLLRRRSA